MKKRIGEGIFMEIGMVDPKLLEKVEKMEEKPKSNGSRQQKRPNVWVAVACCALLFGAGSETVRTLISGGQVTWGEGGRTSYSFEDISKKVYKESENGLFYVFEGANLDASSLCSAENYILDVAIDANGTGYVMAVGGATGSRGYYLFHFEAGTFYLGEGLAQPYEFVEMTDVKPYTPEVDSAYPHLTWNHHATHFLGLQLPEEFYEGNLPEIIQTDLGKAEKIGDSLYFVEGEHSGQYTEWEMGMYVKFKMDAQTDWSAGLNWGYDPEENVFRVHLHCEWTAEREKTAKNILEELGFPYELEFTP